MSEGKPGTSKPFIFLLNIYTHFARAVNDFPHPISHVNLPVPPFKKKQEQGRQKETDSTVPREKQRAEDPHLTARPRTCL